ncbi:MAG: hypothetical protein UY76_C0004G0016 [Candidatus Uhrbacteria bacterium GW2011_GWA2_52_8d]|uniref:Uncharacterized protein n=1 Tax=Candidatus Uhrbacteria bacterium GW2011_GWA2_52_8d TaxID=1618979 RepID=A0A0G2AL78_9BACT|nr:MAG: hypothetical protein UY76_C0004G0016 [Candidatus Uhrbacteria bacterium GW2011_GWA2_52_8d]
MDIMDPRAGRRVDWDELLCGEIPIIGRDFELLERLADLELYRGPMGTMERDGDDLLFQPVIVVVWRHDDPDQHIARPLRETAPRVRLTDHHLVEMPDLMLLVIDRVLQHPLYCLHAPGNNITPPNLFGITPSD